MRSSKKVGSELSRVKLYLLIFLGLAIMFGSGILFWQIQKQNSASSNTENLALKNQIDDLNKRIDELNKTILEAKNASPIVETRSYTKSSGQVAGEQSSRVNGKININSASSSELDSLPGIGASYAARIIEYRESNGGFKSIDEIKNIKGIGDKTFDKLKDLISV